MVIDHNQIQTAFLSLGLFGDKNSGLLRRFGVILNASSVDYLVGREVDFINTLGAQAQPLAEKVLIDAAAWCANATFRGIMDSPEWKGLIEPHVTNPQERFEGLQAITNCLGWGRISNYNLDTTAQELTFDVEYSYYVDYWVKNYGQPQRPICYMWTGVAGGIMDLLFGNKVHEFTGEEVCCAARDGGTRCTFRARRIRKKFGLS